MGDAEKRRHEREAGTGDRTAAVRALRERVREGSLLPWRLELAAYAGDEAAFEALSPEERETLVRHEWSRLERTPLRLWEILERVGEEAQIRAAGGALLHVFERFGRMPVVAGQLPELARILRGRPGREEARLVLHVAREARDATTVVEDHDDLRPLVASAEAFAAAIEGRRTPRDAFMAATAPARTAARPVEGAIDVLRPVASGLDEELAEYVDAPGARAGKRARRLTLKEWAAGLQRWRWVAIVRALVSCQRSFRPTELTDQMTAWLDEPSRAEQILPHRSGQVGLSSHPLGLPDATSFGLVSRFVNDERISERDRRSTLSSALVELALSGAPLFRFDGLDVLEELAHPRGHAYRAVDPGTGDERLLLALDVPVPEARLREIVNPLAKLDHPNLARLVRVGVRGEGVVRPAFLIYARALGVKLEDWLAAERSLEKKLAVIRGVLDGLEHAHARGVVHGCLTASSVLVVGGEARIVDVGHFALERLEDWNADDPPAFSMDPSHAPEFGDDETGTRGDPRTDVYGAAAVAVTILTGRPLFEGGSIIMAYAMQHQEPAPLPYRDAVLRRALAKRPEDRFPSIAAFRAALLE